MGNTAFSPIFHILYSPESNTLGPLKPGLRKAHAVLKDISFLHYN